MNSTVKSAKWIVISLFLCVQVHPVFAELGGLGGPKGKVKSEKEKIEETVRNIKNATETSKNDQQRADAEKARQDFYAATTSEKRKEALDQLKKSVPEKAVKDFDLDAISTFAEHENKSVRSIITKSYPDLTDLMDGLPKVGGLSALRSELQHQIPISAKAPPRRSESNPSVDAQFELALAEAARTPGPEGKRVSTATQRVEDSLASTQGGRNSFRKAVALAGVRSPISEKHLQEMGNPDINNGASKPQSPNQAVATYGGQSVILIREQHTMAARLIDNGHTGKFHRPLSEAQVKVLELEVEMEKYRDHGKPVPESLQTQFDKAVMERAEILTEIRQKFERENHEDLAIFKPGSEAAETAGGAAATGALPFFEAEAAKLKTQKNRTVEEEKALKDLEEKFVKEKDLSKKLENACKELCVVAKPPCPFCNGTKCNGKSKAFQMGAKLISATVAGSGAAWLVGSNKAEAPKAPVTKVEEKNHSK